MDEVLTIMKTEKELEQERYVIAKHMPYMPPYNERQGDYQHSYWLTHTGLLETRYMLRKSFNKKTKKYEYY